jgi:predicted RNA-binding protein with TRAM domain
MRYERRRGFGRRFPPKPVEIGKEYDVKIEETSRRGEGIARIKGLVTFVPNAKPGENVKIRITRISRRFAEAEVVGKTEVAEAEATEEAEEIEESKAEVEATEETEEAEESKAETEETEAKAEGEAEAE